MSAVNGLKPCPFCGSAAIVKRGRTVMVSCTGCTASTFQELCDPDTAIMAWNRRASIPQAPAGPEAGMQHVERGVMVMKNGKAWAQTYADGHSTSYGWVDASMGGIHDPRFCRNPTDITYKGSYLEPELKTGRLVAVTRTTTVEIEQPGAQHD